MTDKPSRNEDEYFARKEAELLEERRRAAAEAAAEAERKSHHMKCPKDGYDLTVEEFQSVKIDRCTHCGGVWLDPGEINLLTAEDDRSMLGRVFGDIAATLRGSKKPA